MIKFIKSIWNKRYMNSVERYRQQEIMAKLYLVIAGLCLCVVFFSMCYWSV